jgi:hypothetical protein
MGALMSGTTIRYSDKTVRCNAIAALAQSTLIDAACADVNVWAVVRMLTGNGIVNAATLRALSFTVAEVLTSMYCSDSLRPLDDGGIS